VLLAFLAVALLAHSGCTTACSLSGIEGQPIWGDGRGGHLPPPAGASSMSP
jgi:hypothetical protein